MAWARFTGGPLDGQRRWLGDVRPFLQMVDDLEARPIEPTPPAHVTLCVTVRYAIYECVTWSGGAYEYRHVPERTTTAPPI